MGADPLAFLRQVARAGYATDPNYFDLLAKVVHTIERHMSGQVSPREGIAPPLAQENAAPSFIERGRVVPTRTLSNE